MGMRVHVCVYVSNAISVMFGTSAVQNFSTGAMQALLEFLRFTAPAGTVALASKQHVCAGLLRAVPLPVHRRLDCGCCQLASADH
jgi:hypothetical protein